MIRRGTLELSNDLNLGNKDLVTTCPRISLPIPFYKVWELSAVNAPINGLNASIFGAGTLLGRAGFY